MAALGRNDSYTAGDTATSYAICACAILSARAISARAIGDWPVPINIRCAGKRYEHPDRHVHGKSILRPGRDENASAMEVCSQQWMASDSPGDFSDKMIKAQTAGLGFRVKSVWPRVGFLREIRVVPGLAPDETREFAATLQREWGRALRSATSRNPAAVSCTHG